MSLSNSLESPEQFSIQTQAGLIRTHELIVAVLTNIQSLMAAGESKLRLPAFAKIGFAPAPLDPTESWKLAEQMAFAIDQTYFATTAFGWEASILFGEAYLELSKDFGNLQPLLFCKEVSIPSLITPSYHAQLLLFAVYKAMFLQKIFEKSDQARPAIVAAQFFARMDLSRRHLMMEPFFSEQHGLNSDTLAMAKLEFVKAQAILRTRQRTVTVTPSTFLPDVTVDKERRKLTRGEKIVDFRRANDQWDLFIILYNAGVKGVLRSEINLTEHIDKLKRRLEETLAPIRLKIQLTRKGPDRGVWRLATV